MSHSVPLYTYRYTYERFVYIYVCIVPFKLNPSNIDLHYPRLITVFFVLVNGYRRQLPSLPFVSATGFAYNIICNKNIV